MFLVMGALAGLVFWQQGRMKSLTAESVALREQLTQAFAGPNQPASPPVLGDTVDQRSPSAPSAELLKLRGEVSLLRHQLAEVSKSTNSPQSDMQTRRMRLAMTKRSGS